MKLTRCTLSLTLFPVLIATILPWRPALAGGRRGLPAQTSGVGNLLLRIRRQGKDASTALLVAKLWELRNDVEPMSLRAFVARLRNQVHLHPIVDFWLARLQGDLSISLGQVNRARALWKAQAMAARAWILGPFPDEFAGGLESNLAPDEDRGVRLDRRPAGRNGPLRWMPLDARPDGCFRPGDVVRPVGHGVLYVAFGLHLARPQALVLRVGTDCPYRVTVDGRKVGTQTASREAVADQEVWPLNIGAGDHVILFKMAAGDTGWGLCLRATDLAGRPFRRGVWLTSGSDLERATALSGSASVRVLPKKKAFSLGEMLARRWRVTKSWMAGRKYVEYLLFVRPDGVRGKVARNVAIELTKIHPGPDSWLLAASAVRESEQLNALYHAFEAAPGSQAVLSRLASWYLDHGRLRAARLFVERAKEVADRKPSGPTVATSHRGNRRLAMLAARIQESGGLWAEAEALVRRVLSLAPWHRSAIKLLVEILLDTDRRAQAIRLLDEAHRQRPGDMVLAQLLYQAASAALQPERALGALRSMLRIRPHDTAVVKRIADLLVSLRRFGHAETILNDAIRSVPGDAGLYRALGRVLLAKGDRRGAANAWLESLERAPQQQDLRAKLAVMKAVRPDPTVVRYRVDLADVLRRAPRPRGDAEVLMDRMVYVMRSNGAIHRFRQRVVRINSSRGARRISSWSISLQPDVQELKILDARVRHADGSLQDAEIHYEREIADWQVRIYYDWKSYGIQFPKLHPGDVVEMVYTLSDVARYNPFRGYLGLLFPLAEEIPRRLVELIVEAPAGRHLYYNTPRVRSLVHESERRGGIRVHRWKIRDVQAVIPEPRAPGWSELVPHLHVSTFRSWSHVARWYWGLVHEQYRSSPEVDALARRLGRGTRTKEEKVKAVYDFVTRKVRYVGLEFGIHTHKPYSAPEVLERRFGDCKDKAMLMVVLLRRLGVQAYPVLVRTRHNGNLGGFPASLAPFDHAVVFVPGLHRFLDGTAEFTGPDDLPYQDQGVMGLVVGPKVGRLVTLPVLAAGRNSSSRFVRVKVRRNGSALVKERIQLTGQFAAQWRERFRDESRRRKSMEVTLGKMYPGAMIQSLRVVGDRDPSMPLVVTMRYRVPGLLRDVGSDKLLDLGSGRGRMVVNFAPLTHRTQDVILDFPFVLESRIDVRLPRGVTVKSFPLSMQRRIRKLGLDLSFVQSVSTGKQTIHLSRRLKIESYRISARSYSIFRAFCRTVDAAMADQVIIEGRRRR